MKKFLIVLTIIFIANLSCKKDPGLCACSPPVSPYLSIVIKNTAGNDLLSSATAGFYARGQIQLFYKDATGTTKNIDFFVNQPFSYGNDKFLYNQLYSVEIVGLARAGINVFFLKLGNDAPYEISIEIDNQKLEISKLLIDKKEALKETGTVTHYGLGNIFYLVK